MSTPLADPASEWARFVDVIEKVMAADDLLPQVIAGVRTIIAEVASLPVSDMTGHTRALLTAAGRALAARRGPTEAELAFVEQLAITRARQGIPIEVVLSAIRVSERAIWSRARELAEVDGVSTRLLLDARELYDDWAEAVRSRLIQAHRDAPRQDSGTPWDRDVEVLRRLLEGGSAATLAAAETGFPSGGGLWVLVTRSGDSDSTRALRRLLDGRGTSLAAQLGDTLVGVLSRRPVVPTASQTPAGSAVVGMAGPVVAEEVGAAHRMAVSTVPTAEALGRAGVVHVSEVAGIVALMSRNDLAAVLVAQHREAYAELGPSAVPVARTVRAWLETDRDTSAAARSLFVHDNTVRNRVQRFTQATGIDPMSTFGALDAWWLCVSWLTEDT